MLIDTILMIALAIIYAIGKLLAIIPFIVPNQIENAIFYLVSYLSYFRGILPIDDILTAIGFLVLFQLYWFLYKLIRFAFAHIPWIGKTVPSPRLKK